MPTHLYCLLSTADDGAMSVDPPVQGIDDSFIRALPLDPPGSDDGIVAWVSTVERGTINREMPAIETLVQRHDDVTRVALVRTSGVVPALLTDPYADDASCRTALRARIDELRRLLVRADGMVEMTLLLGVDPLGSRSSGQWPTIPDGDSNTAAAGATAGSTEAAGGRPETPSLAFADDVERVARELSAAVQPMVADASSRGSPYAGRFSLSHLIAREGITGYHAAVARVAVPDSLRLVVDGPRAPYSFAAFADRRPPARPDSGELGA